MRFYVAFVNDTVKIAKAEGNESIYTAANILKEATNSTLNKRKTILLEMNNE